MFYGLLLLLCSGCARKEKLLLGGTGCSQIMIMDKESGRIEWSYPLPVEVECSDVEMTSGGNILYAGRLHARLVTRDRQPVWTFEAREREAVYTATQLKSGNYMLAIAGFPARIVELDREGQVVSEVQISLPAVDETQQFRQILKTPEGTYLIPFLDKHKVLELAEDGRRVLRSYFCGGTPYSVKLLDSGNWLISTGAGRSVVEVDPATRTVVRKTDSGSMTFGTLLYAGESQRLKTGNTLIANWNGNAGDSNSDPAVLEVDTAGRVVWRMPYNPAITHISTLHSFFE